MSAGIHVRAPGDQAEGLRRLIGRQDLRITLFMSGRRRAGNTTAATGMAIAAAQFGRSVLLLDESRSANDAAAVCGLKPRWDLLDAMRGDRAIEEVILPGPEGVLILPAARAVRSAGDFGERARAVLENGFERLAANVDWLVIDAACASDTRLLPLALSAQDVVVSLPEEGTALTDSYALIKLLHREFGLERVNVLASRMRGEARAREQCLRLAQAAHRHLGMNAHCMGAVPLDTAVQRASALARPLMQAFPASPAAHALRAHAEALHRLPAQPQVGSPVGALVQRLIEGSRLDFAGVALA